VEYESRYEVFEATGQDGATRRVAFQKAGILAAGNQPELYFFEVNARLVVVGVSGEALASWQRSKRFLSREEKIDMAGLFVKHCMEQSREPVAEKLFIGPAELESLLAALGIRG